MSWQRSPLSSFLRQRMESEWVGSPDTESFVTIRLYGRGASKRSIGDGKTPKAFRGARVRAGDFVYSRIDARHGAFALVPDALEGAVVSKDFPIFEIDRSRVDARYLNWLVTSKPFYGQIQKMSFGATNRQRVAETTLLGFDIPLPPLPGQRRIAEILDRADELRAKRRRALSLLDELRESSFSAFFLTNVGANTLGSASLGEVARFYAGNSLPSGVGYVGQEGGTLLIKVSDLNLEGNERFIHRSVLWSATTGSTASTAPAGSVVIPKRGGAISTNKKRLLTRPSALDPNLMAIAPSKVLNSSYLEAWFRRLDLSTLITGSSVPQLNKQDLAPLSIEVPPIALQEDFAVAVAQIDLMHESLSAHLAKLDELFASLQQRAFSGQL